MSGGPCRRRGVTRPPRLRVPLADPTPDAAPLAGQLPSRRGDRPSAEWEVHVYRILSSTPSEATDGHVDLSYRDRSGWSVSMGAAILPIMVGDDHCGPFLVLSQEGRFVALE